MTINVTNIQILQAQPLVGILKKPSAANKMETLKDLHLCFKDTKHMLQNRPLKLECSKCLYTWTAPFPELWHHPCL